MKEREWEDERGRNGEWAFASLEYGCWYTTSVVVMNLLQHISRYDRVPPRGRKRKKWWMGFCFNLIGWSVFHFTWSKVEQALTLTLGDSFLIAYKRKKGAHQLNPTGHESLRDTPMNHSLRVFQAFMPSRMLLSRFQRAPWEFISFFL